MNGKQMTQTELEELLKESNAAINSLTTGVNSSLIMILDNALKLSQTLSGVKISRDYPHKSPNSNGKAFTESYLIKEGGIYRLVWDPTANIMDPGESHEDQTSKEEFLSWMNQDSSRVLDVLQYLQKYIQDAPAYLRLIRSNQRDFTKAATRYP